jgi:hypothetical protein
VPSTLELMDRKDLKTAAVNRLGENTEAPEQSDQRILRNLLRDGSVSLWRQDAVERVITAAKAQGYRAELGTFDADTGFQVDLR